MFFIDSLSNQFVPVYHALTLKANLTLYMVGTSLRQLPGVLRNKF